MRRTDTSIIEITGEEVEQIVRSFLEHRKLVDARGSYEISCPATESGGLPGVIIKQSHAPVEMPALPVPPAPAAAAASPARAETQLGSLPRSEADFLDQLAGLEQKMLAE